MKIKQYQPGEWFTLELAPLILIKCFDIQECYPNHLEEYLTKSLEDKPNNYDFIKPMTYDGFDWWAYYFKKRET